tara:strand:- start:4754 stop:5362 length:609 start_codon:yes stop_codon:yes gene_type:complete
MDVKLPKTANDLRIQHFKAFNEWNEDGMETMDKARFISAFTGKHINIVLAMDNDMFEKMYNHALTIISKLKINASPPKEITMRGIEYVMINPDKTSAGWHMDWGNVVKESGYEKDPVKVACLFYHPKGHFYGEVDSNSNLVHPIRDKYDIFKKEMPLSIFIECSRFFLLKLVRSTITSTEKKIWERRTVKFLTRIKLLRGKK